MTATLVPFEEVLERYDPALGEATMFRAAAVVEAAAPPLEEAYA